VSAIVRQLGRVDYAPTWRAMQAFTAARDADTPDELWFLEHAPVFTQGLNGRPEHVLAPGDIPVVRIDRGGQVTYHGPGQLVMYALVDLRRLRIGVRELVVALENAVIALAAQHGIRAAGRREAPGVYVEGRKLASIGLRVRRGCSYHGLALNVDMDLEPFGRLNPARRRRRGLRARAARLRRARHRLGRRLARRGGIPAVASKRDEHDAAVSQVLVDPVELRAALRADRIGEREEAPLAARALADALGRDRSDVALDDGEREGAKRLRVAAHHLDRELAGKPEQLVGPAHAGNSVENSRWVALNAA
jgi:lipoyl(octanoyl) transferase